MADNESNPAFLIIGLIGTLVLIFFVGNIWAYVSLHARVIREQSALLVFGRTEMHEIESASSTYYTHTYTPSTPTGTSRPRSGSPRSPPRRWARRNARGRCSRRAFSKLGSKTLE